MEYCKGYNSLALGIQEICVKISDSVFHTSPNIVLHSHFMVSKPVDVTIVHFLGYDLHFCFLTAHCWAIGRQTVPLQPGYTSWPLASLALAGVALNLPLLLLLLFLRGGGGGGGGGANLLALLRLLFLLLFLKLFLCASVATAATRTTKATRDDTWNTHSYFSLHGKISSIFKTFQRRFQTVYRVGSYYFERCHRETKATVFTRLSLPLASSDGFIRITKKA